MKTTCTFLGTGAADLALLRKTDCHDRFDMNARRGSCMMIGKNILIDCGWHVFDSIRIAKINVDEITDIFVTHLHADHFTKEHAEQIAEGKKVPVRLWCKQNANIPPMKNVEVIKMEEGIYYHVLNGINAMSVPANHDEASTPHHLLFNVNGKKVLYATDGAWMLTRTAQILKKHNLDFFIVDATCGDYVGDFRFADHNSLPMIRMMLPSLKKLEIINEQTNVILTHIAPSLHLPHDETQKLVANDGWCVAFDGMTFEI